MDAMVKELTVEDIPEGAYKQIAESIGVTNLCKLAALVGGSTVYIPKVESLIRPVRDAHIKAEFNGYNYADLARKYNVSERWVRLLCGSGHMDGQYDLFNLANQES